MQGIQAMMVFWKHGVRSGVSVYSVRLASQNFEPRRPPLPQNASMSRSLMGFGMAGDSPFYKHGGSSTSNRIKDASTISLPVLDGAHTKRMNKLEWVDFFFFFFLLMRDD